jgi:hypothetical protein
VREHERIGPKQLARPFYYSRWYCCLNRNCKTKLIMPEEFKVWTAVDALHPGDDVVMDELVISQSASPPWDE